MNPLRVLLIQARNGDDPMIQHEIDCVSRRLDGRNITLSVRNAVVESARSNWLAGMDAVLIGGSGDYSVHHPLSRRFVDPMRDVLDTALAKRMPGFGLCFGHQLLGLHLGSEVVTDPASEEVGTIRVEKTLAGRNDPLLKALPDTFSCHTGHSDCLVRVPEGATLLLTNARTMCQAIRVKGMHFYGTQFHPDLTGEEARWRYLANKRDERGILAEKYEEKAAAYVERDDESTSLLDAFVSLI